MTAAAKIADRPTQLLAAEHRASADLADLRRDLTTAVADVAAATAAHYADGGPAPDTSKPAALQAQIDAVSEAIDAVRDQRRDALEQTYRLNAAAKFDEAKAKRAESEAVAAKTAALLEDLARVEGCAYVPGVAGATVGGIVVRSTPLSKRLEAEARALEIRANELDRQPAQCSGEAEAADVDGLLAIACGDPLTIGPTRAELLTWATEAAASARAGYRKSHADAEPASILLHIEWEDGALQRRNRAGHDPCRVETPADADAVFRAHTFS